MIEVFTYLVFSTDCTLFSSALIGRLFASCPFGMGGLPYNCYLAPCRNNKNVSLGKNVRAEKIINEKYDYFTYFTLTYTDDGGHPVVNVLV